MISVSRTNRELFARIDLPASKSISNRLLILQHHYGKSLQVSHLSKSDDTLLLASLLELLRQYLLKGSHDILRLDAQNAGTAFRFLTALLSMTRGHYLLTGNDRMKRRPVGPLVDSLREIGADIEYPEQVGYPPVLIKGRNLTGGHVKLDASLSSQFLSALLLIAPMLEDGLTIDAAGTSASWPYVGMTLQILDQLGIRVIPDESKFIVAHKEKVSGRIETEPDWSAASFWYCMLSMADRGEVFFPGLKRTGCQGDEIASDFFEALGINTSEIEGGILIRKTGQDFLAGICDFTGCPDLAMPVILAHAVAGTGSVFAGLERLKIKESDRLSVLVRELGKTGTGLIPKAGNNWGIGGKIRSGSDFFVDDARDHRVAMTFACLAMKGYKVFIGDPEVVSKSYPGFWKDLRSAGFDVQESC